MPAAGPSNTPTPAGSAGGYHRSALTARGGLVILILAVAVGLPACASSSGATSDDETAETEPPPPRPGARDWSGAALTLPAQSPVVGTIRLDALMKNARGLRAWISEEPQMFGDDGEAFVRRIEAGWNQIRAGLGADPLTERATEKLGVDAARPIRAGLYAPEATDGRTFVETFESTVRTELDLEPDEPLEETLEKMRNGERDIPSDLHSNVAGELEQLEPHAGFRVLIPVADPDLFADQFAAAATAVDYEAVELPGLGAPDASEEEPGNEMRGFVNSSSRWPAVALRLGDDWATVDAILPEPGTRPLEFQGDERREYLRRELAELIETGGTGRPRAPRPIDDPAFAVSADQHSTSVFARMRAYKRVLGRASRTAVDRRSLALVEGLSRATAIADQWSTAADALTGVSYGFYGLPDGQTDRYFRLGMTLYGPTPEDDPTLDPAEVGLGVDDRAAGVSLDLAPLFSEAWNRWLGHDKLTDLAGDSRVATDHPALYLLSFPRNLILFFVNAETLVEPSIPTPLRSLYERRHDLRRLEIATSGLDVGAMVTDPRVVGLLSFDREAAAEDVDFVVELLPAMMSLGFETLGPADETPEKAFDRARESFTRDELAAFPLPETHPAHPFHYYVHTENKRAFIFFSHGLSEEDARAEVSEILDGSHRVRGDSALFSRLEPAALTALLTAFDPNALDPLDPGILTQRLGALELSIQPVRGEGLQMLQYQLDLQKPPEL